MRTIDYSGSMVFYDALFVVDIPCIVSDTLNRVLYAMYLLVIDVYSYAFVYLGI